MKRIAHSLLMVSLILILAIMTLGLVSASVCSDTKRPSEQCTLITPVLNCTVYNYEIINITGNVTSNGSLTLINAAGIYTLNVTENISGTYVVRLCDDTTREIQVGDVEDTTMLSLGLILLPMLLAFLFMLGAMSLDKDHNLLRTFLFLLCFPLFWTSFHYGLLSVIKFYDWPEMQEALAGTTYWTSVLYWFIVSYFIIYWIAKIFYYLMGKKEERMNY